VAELILVDSNVAICNIFLILDKLLHMHRTAAGAAKKMLPHPETGRKQAVFFRVTELSPGLKGLGETASPRAIIMECVAR
jgi:hypothetical protein